MAVNLVARNPRTNRRRSSNDNLLPPGSTAGGQWPIQYPPNNFIIPEIGYRPSVPSGNIAIDEDTGLPFTVDDFMTPTVSAAPAYRSPVTTSAAPSASTSAATRVAPAAVTPRVAPAAVRPPVDPWAEFNPQRGQTGFGNNVTLADLMNIRVNPNWRPQVPAQNAPGSFWDNLAAERDRLRAEGLMQPPPPPPPSGGGGGAGGGSAASAARADTLSRATAALEAQLAGLGGLYGNRLSGIQSMYGSQLGELAGSFGGYRDSLSQLANASRGQINDATSQALARLAELDPQAAFQWAVGEVGTPGVAGSQYLSAIGANSAEVDAVRMLSDQLMRQQLSAAQQYSMGAQSSMDRERQARQAASGLMSQEALNALAQTEQMRGTQIADEQMRRRQAMESAMRQEMAAVEAERLAREQALRDQLLRYQLEYDLGL